MWGTVSDYPSIRSYEKAKQVYDATKPLRGTNDRPLEARSHRCKSWIKKHGDTYVIQIYRTDVVTYYPDGSIFINCRNWVIPITAQAIHMMSPFNCWKRGGDLVVSLGRPNYGDGLKFIIPSKGLMFKPDESGNLLPVNPPPAKEYMKRVKKEEAKKARAFFKQVPVYIKAFSAVFEGGTRPETPVVIIKRVYDTGVLTEDHAVALAWSYVSTTRDWNTGTRTIYNAPNLAIASFWKNVYRVLDLIETVTTVLPYGEVPK